MIINNDVITNESFGMSNQQAFKMQQSRKAFQILSDLYSDKPLAIVRELSCNAIDSMVAAGKSDQPIEIILPSILNPNLTIQDFGLGLSEEDIYNVYTVYFSSTKTSNNDQIGCLGLGSKSPFCYSDSFIIVSVFGGIETTYSAFFDSDGFPALGKIGSVPTDKCNGVSISIPVKTDDFSKFFTAVKTFFKFHSLKPIIEGGNIVWDDNSKRILGDSWFFINKENNYYSSSFAIMGGVTYPINKNIFSDRTKKVLESNIVLQFNIGELDVSPSRESLSYCEQTIKAINDKIKEVDSSLEAKFKKGIDGCATFKDLCNFIYECRENLLGMILPCKRVQWKDFYFSPFEGSKFDYEIQDYLKSKNISVSFYQNICSWKKRTSVSQTNITLTKLCILDEVLIVKNCDISHISSKQLIAFMRECGKVNVKYSKDKFFTISNDSIPLLEALGFSFNEIISLDEIKRLLKEVRKHNRTTVYISRKGKTSVLKYAKYLDSVKGYRTTSDSFVMEENSTIENAGGYYFVVSNRKSSMNFPFTLGTFHFENSKNFLKFADNFCDGKPIYIVSEKDEKKLTKMGLVSFKEAFKNLKIDSSDIVFALGDYSNSSYNRIRNRESYFSELNGKTTYYNNPTYIFLKTFVDNIKKVKKFLETHPYYHSILKDGEKQPQTDCSHLPGLVSYCLVSDEDISGTFFKKIVDSY